VTIAVVLKGDDVDGVAAREAGQLVGTPLESLLPEADQRRLRGLLQDFRRSGPSASRRTTFQIGSRRLAARLNAICEQGECTGIVVLVEVDESTLPRGE